VNYSYLSWHAPGESKSYLTVFNQRSRRLRLTMIPDVVVVYADGCYPEKTAQVLARDYSWTREFALVIHWASGNCALFTGLPAAVSAKPVRSLTQRKNIFRQSNLLSPCKHINAYLPFIRSNAHYPDGFIISEPLYLNHDISLLHLVHHPQTKRAW